MLKRLNLIFGVMLLSVVSVIAQTATPTPMITPTPYPTDPNANIEYPPPVYVVGGEVDVVGTANVERQTGYFLEYQSLDIETLEPDFSDAGIWIPVTLSNPTPLMDGLLGKWDTTNIENGLYSLRLTVNLQFGTPVYALASPIRVDNNAPSLTDALAGQQTQAGVLDDDTDIANALLSLTATAAAGGGSTTGQIVIVTPPSLQTGGNNGLLPTPTEIGAGQLIAEVIVVANLRTGDSTIFDIADGLMPGTRLPVLGRSPRNNWLYVRTPNGELGWIAPSVVNLNGLIGAAPLVEPPPLPATVGPVPASLTEPAPLSSLVDARVSAVEVDRSLKQGEPFQIIVTVSNDGQSFLDESILFCNVEPMDTEVAMQFGNIQPGQASRAALTLVLNEGGGNDVTIFCKIDMNNTIVEANEDNNIGSVTRSLDEAD